MIKWENIGYFFLNSVIKEKYTGRLLKSGKSEI